MSHQIYFGMKKIRNFLEPSRLSKRMTWAQSAVADCGAKLGCTTKSKTCTRELPTAHGGRWGYKVSGGWFAHGDPFHHGNLRVPTPPMPRLTPRNSRPYEGTINHHCPLITPIRALFLGGGGIGGVPLDSHDFSIVVKSKKFLKVFRDPQSEEKTCMYKLYIYILILSCFVNI